MEKPPIGLKTFFWITDIGFILYWLITLLQVIPEELLFKDYDNPILQAWNWSFLPLDLAISATGLASLLLFRREHRSVENAGAHFAYADLLFWAAGYRVLGIAPGFRLAMVATEFVFVVVSTLVSAATDLRKILAGRLTSLVRSA